MYNYEEKKYRHREYDDYVEKGGKMPTTWLTKEEMISSDLGGYS